MPTTTGGFLPAESFYQPQSRRHAATELAEARQHFFLPRRYRDPFGQDAFVDFDAHDLLMVETRDALGNRVTVDANDYRVLQPRLVSDPNRNRTEVAFDALGMVVGTAVMGKPHRHPAARRQLDGPSRRPTASQIDAFIAMPREHPHAERERRHAAAHDCWPTPRPASSTTWTGSAPQLAIAMPAVRRHNRPRNPRQRSGAGQQSKIQISFSLLRRLRPRDPEEDPGRAGAARRRRPGGESALGRQRLDGLQQQGQAGPPVRALLLATHRFEFGVTIGVSPVLFYDPAERVVATLHPNHTYEKVVFDPWQQTTYDVNDTCAAPVRRPGIRLRARPATRAPTPTSAAMSPGTS